MKPLRNHIMFRFETDVLSSTSGGRARTQFKEITKWGFDLGKAEQSFDTSTKKGQWGHVTEIGHKVIDVKIGDRILIEPLKWTVSIIVEGIKYWRTDEDSILAIDVS